jgi:hypothetical protein
MPDSLAQLEEQKTELFRQIADLGDFRRGSITTTSGNVESLPVIVPGPMILVMGPTFASPERFKGRRSPKRLILPYSCARPSGKWKLFIVFRNSVTSSLPPTRASVPYAPWTRL